MTHLTHELAVWQAELQRLDAAAAQLNANAAQQDQLAAAAAARAAAASADATRLRNEAAAFQQQVASLDAQIQAAQAELAQTEPTFEGLPGKPPRPNPAYTSLKTKITSLTSQRDQARASASARSAAADQAAATAAAEDQNAKRIARDAEALRQQANAVLAQKTPANQQVTAITRWQQEIAREPIDFAAADVASRELAAAIATLETRYAGALDSASSSDKRQRYVQALAAELTRKVTDLNSQLAALASQVATETKLVSDLNTHIRNVLLRKSL